MDQPDTPPNGPQSNVAPWPHRFVRRLTLLFASAAASIVLLLGIHWMPSGVLPGAQALVAEAINGGAGALVLSVMLLGLTGLVGTLALTTARYQFRERTGPTDAIGVRPSRFVSRFHPGFTARQGQALLMPTGALLIYLASWLLWPAEQTVAANGNATLLAAAIFALAFVSLVAERSMHAFPELQLPEAPSLRRLLLLMTVLLFVGACLELGRGGGLEWIRWPMAAGICVSGIVAAELVIRASARLFLPEPAPAASKAVTESLVAALLTGGPRAPGLLLRTHLGLDFARSWALSYLSAALLPALVATAFFCWGLSGVKLIDLGERGIYERFGAPIAVLAPGFHVLLPWPFGRLRPVEYGTIHSVAIGVDGSLSSEEQSVAAEALPPLSLNRLWESAHPGQAEYLVPSPSTGLQGFQTVSTEISVLYRVGLTDIDALNSVYTVAVPAELVKEAASRLVLRYFNSRTLEEVLGERRENIADVLRTALALDLQTDRTGIDIVSVLIEEIHPPAGAAAAYHAVQAAQINASASISDENGRARRTAGTAQQEAHQLISAATAQAGETLHTAGAEAYQFRADQRASAEGGRAFLFERSNRNLVGALIQTPLTIVDHRLSAAQSSIIDLRSTAIATSTASSTAAPVTKSRSISAGQSAAAPTPLPIIPEADGYD